ncbi:guanine nucleotide-binding protein subunit beta-like protein 1 isoform X2 [Rhopilema esculentum]
MKTRRSILTIDTKASSAILKVINLENKRILSHDRNGIITVWNLNDLEPTAEETFAIYQFGFCPVSVVHEDESILVCYQSNSDSQLDIIDWKDKRIVKQLKPDKKVGMVMQAKLFKEKRRDILLALIGYENGSVALWNASSGDILTDLKVHNDAVMCLDVDSDFSKVAVGSVDNRLVQVALPATSGESLKEVRSADINSNGISCLKVRPDNKILAAGCWDGKIRLFGWKKLKPLAVLKYHVETVNCIMFTLHNDMVCGSKDGKISVWHIY